MKLLKLIPLLLLTACDYHSLNSAVVGTNDINEFAVRSQITLDNSQCPGFKYCMWAVVEDDGSLAPVHQQVAVAQTDNEATRENTDRVIENAIIHAGEKE